MNTILRFEPISEDDEVLLRHCSTQPPLGKHFQRRIGGEDRNVYSFISTHNQDTSQYTIPSSTKMAFWMGVGELTVLALLDGSERGVKIDEVA